MTPVSHGSPGNDQTVLEPGVHYVCQRCNACCQWPGDVRVSAHEITRIACFLGMAEGDFISRYTRLRTNRTGLSLVEKENHECVMLENGGCRIHAVKPSQCAGFPNKWNFPGWRGSCRAIPVPVPNTLGGKNSSP
jgi:Fe-S-cluster containining protein